MKAAIDYIDDDSKAVAGKWSALTWTSVQGSAVATLLMPSTIHQGGTTLCGAVTVLEAMAMHRPMLYARLVLAVWNGRVETWDGKPWGDTPALKPELLAASPPDSITANSIADWMTATAMIAELKDQSFFRDLLGHDDYLGQDAHGPDGATIDHARGLTTAWDVSKFIRDLLGCASTRRELSYWAAREAPLNQVLDLTSTGALERGTDVVIMLISDTLWRDCEYYPAAADKPGWYTPQHWVRLRSIEDVGGGMLTVKVFSFGEVQSRELSRAGFGRLVFEFIFGSF